MESNAVQIQATQNRVIRIFRELTGGVEIGNPSPKRFLQRLVRSSTKIGDLRGAFDNFKTIREEFKGLIEKEFPGLVKAEFAGIAETVFQDVVTRADFEGFTEKISLKLLIEKSFAQRFPGPETAKEAEQKLHIEQRILLERRIQELRLDSNVLGLCVMSAIGLAQGSFTYFHYFATLMLSTVCSHAVLFCLHHDKREEIAEMLGSSTEDNTRIMEYMQEAQSQIIFLLGSLIFPDLVMSRNVSAPGAVPYREGGRYDSTRTWASCHKCSSRGSSLCRLSDGKHAGLQHFFPLL